MPAWITHLEIACKIKEKIGMNNNEFLFGNVMPDIFMGYLIKDASKVLPYEITHYSKHVNINGIPLQLPDYLKFKEEYKDKMNNPLICGYFCHIITDYYWNNYSFSKYFKIHNLKEDIVEIKLKNGEKKILKWEDATHIKQGDFRVFKEYLKNKNKIEIPIYSDKILEFSKELKEVEYTKEDILKSIQYINDEMKEENDLNKEYQMFTEEEMNKILNDNIDFILEQIDF